MKKFNLGIDEKYGYKRIVPTPTDEEISKFYADEFYSSHYGALNDSSVEVQIKDKAFYDSRWEDISDSLVDLIGSLQTKKILDIGCGWGQALMYFKEKGMDCYGFDPAKDAIDFAKKNGLNVVCAGLNKADVFEKKFDVVTMINVLEHLSEPEKILQEIRQGILKEDGCLVIDVPNEFNTFQRIANDEYGLNEWWVVPPAHLNYFDLQSLTRLLSGCGFKVEISESSFPLEVFMLFGEVYVGDSELGRSCHEKRMLFERLMRKHGQTQKLRQLYRSFASQGLGRQIVVYARPI